MRRRRTAAPSPDPDDFSARDDNASEPVSPEPTPEVPTPSEPAPATPRRRTSSRRKSTEPESVAETPESAEAPPETPTPEKPRRTRTRRTPAPETAPPADETPETPVAEEPPVAPPAPERPARRRGRRTAAPDPTSEPAAEATDEGGEETASEDSPRRTRGLRRTRTVAAPTLMDLPSAPEPSPMEESEGESAAPKRTRGQRRARPVTAELAPTPAPAPAAEPLPPVYQPLAPEVLARLPETRIAVRKGVSELLINGEPRQPLWFFVNTETEDGDQTVAQRQIRLAYEAGVRIFTILAHLPWRTRSGERRFEPLDDALRFITDNAPDALILPRLIFSPPGSFVRAHDGDMVRYHNGETGDISIASRAFWENEADQAVRAAVEHIAEGEHAHRIFGLYLEHGEWLYEKGMGYDFSEASRQGFRAWLRARYRTDVALRAAWNDGSVTLATAEIPAWPPPVAAGPLLFSLRERRWADFHEYSSDAVAAVIVRLGRAVKEASGERLAVAVSYGYTLELPRAHTGHLALGTVLASPYIDILTGPVSYAARMPGGSAPLPVPIDSVTLAGKLWISEDDTKTHLASGTTPDVYNPRIASAEGTRAVHARNFGAALARGAGVSWMDLWGEGWLDDREIWETLGALRTLADQLAQRRHNTRTNGIPDPDVAVIVDERTYAGVRTEALLETLIANQRDTLLRSGARLGFYLLSDLTKKSFPARTKLLIFLGAVPQDAATRTAIRERFQDDGRTLAWIFGPLSVDANLAELSETLGITLRLQPWGSKTGAQVLSSVRSPLTDAVRGETVGEEKRTNPSYYAADPKATVLAEYPGGGAAIATRKHPRWQSVFIGEPTLSLPLLRGLYRLAGVETVTVDDDVAWIGDSLICLHSAPGGGTTVYLPEDAGLYDALSGETLASGGRGARLSMPPRGTRLLFFGTAGEIARLGGDVSVAPPGLSETELPTPPAPFVFASPSALPVTQISAEDEALFTAALETLPALVEEADEIAALDDAEDEAGEGPDEEIDGTGDAGERKKRRRRRRRGRGRRDEGDELSADGLTPVGEGVETEGEATPARPRPSLEELLPLSEIIAEDAELPPIPEEFLPLDVPPASAAEEALPILTRRPRRPRRPRPEPGEASPSPEPES
jgi:hypothetical protein